MMMGMMMMMMTITMTVLEKTTIMPKMATKPCALAADICEREHGFPALGLFSAAAVGFAIRQDSAMDGVRIVT